MTAANRNKSEALHSRRVKIPQTIDNNTETASTKIGSRANLLCNSVKTQSQKINKKDIVHNWLHCKQNEYQMQQEQVAKQHFIDERKKKKELLHKTFMFVKKFDDEGSQSVFDQFQQSKLKDLKSRQNGYDRSVTHESPRFIRIGPYHKQNVSQSNYLSDARS